MSNGNVKWKLKMENHWVYDYSECIEVLISRLSRLLLSNSQHIFSEHTDMW